MAIGDLRHVLQTDVRRIIRLQILHQRESDFLVPRGFFSEVNVGQQLEKILLLLQRSILVSFF